MNDISVYLFNDKYKNYLSDESQKKGYADYISFPPDTETLRKVLLSVSDEKVTFQGGLTGLDGLAVPNGGLIISMSKLSRILSIEPLSDNDYVAVVEAGVTLSDLENAVNTRIRERSFFWPPNPTEGSATIGGIVSTNAYGSNRFFYGDTLDYVTGLKFIDKSGELKEINAPVKDRFHEISGPITELSLKLIRKPKKTWGVAAFFESENSALYFCDKLKNLPLQSGDAFFTAMEYLDENSLALVKNDGSNNPAIRALPPPKDSSKAMICMEISGAEESIEERLLTVMDLIEECGGNPENTWAMSEDREVKKLQDFKHAVTETLLQRIAAGNAQDNRIIRLGLRYRGRRDSFEEDYLEIKQLLKTSGLDYIIYGHIWDTDLEINIMPACYDDYLRGAGILSQIQHRKDL